MAVAPERDRFTDRVLIQLPPQVQARAAFLRSIGVEQKSEIIAVQDARRDGMSIEDLASALSVDVRTIYRYLNTSTPCPGPRCLTMVRGGGLCSFCRRTPVRSEYNRDAGLSCETDTMRDGPDVRLSPGVGAVRVSRRLRP